MNEHVSKKKINALTDDKSEALKNSPSVLPNSVMESIARGTAAPTSAMLGQRESLAPSLQAKMQGAFGADFGNVEIYRSETARDAGFKGIASGNKVALSPDVDLNSHVGQSVLGHELSHVVAQAQGIGGGRGFLGNSSLERQADIQGEMAASGMRAVAGSGLSETTSLDLSAPTMSMGGAETAGLTPISATSGAFGMGAPMQGKKNEDEVVSEESSNELVVPESVTSIPEENMAELPNDMTPAELERHNANRGYVSDFYSRARSVATDPNANPNTRSRLIQAFGSNSTAGLANTLSTERGDEAVRSRWIKSFRQRNPDYDDGTKTRFMRVLGASVPNEQMQSLGDDEIKAFLNHAEKLKTRNQATPEEYGAHANAIVDTVISAGANITAKKRALRGELESSVPTQGDAAARLIRISEDQSASQMLRDLLGGMHGNGSLDFVPQDKRDQLEKNVVLPAIMFNYSGPQLSTPLGSMESQVGNTQEHFNNPMFNSQKKTMDFPAFAKESIDRLNATDPTRGLTYEGLWGDAPAAAAPAAAEQPAPAQLPAPAQDANPRAAMAKQGVEQMLAYYAEKKNQPPEPESNPFDQEDVPQANLINHIPKNERKRLFDHYKLPRI